MKTSMKKVLSLALAGALALTSVFSANVADASNAKKAAAVPTAKLSIAAAKDKAVNASTTVTGVAVSTKGALACKYDAKLATSIASASAVVVSGDAIKVTVTATKAAVACTDAAVSVLSANKEVAKVLVTIKGAAKTKATKSLKFKKNKVVVAAGKSTKVAYTVKKVATADAAKKVTVSSANKKIAKATLIKGKKKVKVSVPRTARQAHLQR